MIISFAEHNGTYTAAYKNLFDWCSRIKKPYQNKPMLMLSTSPDARGGATVLQQAVSSAVHFDGDVRGSLAIPSFYEHFDIELGRLTDEVLNAALLVQLNQLK